MEHKFYRVKREQSKYKSNIERTAGGKVCTLEPCPVMNQRFEEVRIKNENGKISKKQNILVYKNKTYINNNCYSD